MTSIESKDRAKEVSVFDRMIHARREDCETATAFLIAEQIRENDVAKLRLHTHANNLSIVIKLFSTEFPPVCPAGLLSSHQSMLVKRPALAGPFTAR